MTQSQLGTSSAGRPGQMTAVMRAMPQATGPKVLRIGLVQSGKVIEERVVKQRGHVTIGPSEKCMFVIPSKSIPPNFRLFEIVGSDYHLNFLDGMTGRVALRTGVSELAALKGQAKKVALPTGGNAFQVQLSEEARGKVVVGETTFLFQFVAPPPPTAKPQLPVSVKGGGDDVDWRTTIIAAFSFLFHFGAIGTIYSDWMDPTVDDEVEVAQLLESVKQLPPPPVVETAKEVDVPVASAQANAETPKAAAGGASKGSGGGSSGKGRISDQRAAAISSELDRLNVAMIAAINSGGSATQSVLGQAGDVPLGMLDASAASGAGVGAGGVAGLNLGGGGGGIFRPGAGGGGGGLKSIGDTSSAGPATAGSAQKVKGPVGSASIGGASVSGGSVANASSVVAGMAAGFRRCYNNGLKEDPNMKGSVRITARIGPNGEVQGASASGGGLSPSVISCVQARVASAQFAPPEGGGATVVIPVTFISQ